MTQIVFPNAGRDGANPKRTFNVTVLSTGHIMIDIDASSAGRPLSLLNTLTIGEAEVFAAALDVALNRPTEGDHQ